MMLIHYVLLLYVLYVHHPVQVHFLTFMLMPTGDSNIQTGNHLVKD
jgi:hypothetical protein